MVRYVLTILVLALAGCGGGDGARGDEEQAWCCHGTYEECDAGSGSEFRCFEPGDPEAAIHCERGAPCCVNFLGRWGCESRPCGGSYELTAENPTWVCSMLEPQGLPECTPEVCDFVGGDCPPEACSYFCWWKADFDEELGCRPAGVQVYHSGLDYRTIWPACLPPDYDCL